MALGFWSFEELLTQWESWGVFNVIMPFLLFFAIVYSILDKAKILGDNREGINAVIALVIAFIAIRNQVVIQFTSVLFANMAIGIVVLFVLLIFLGFILEPKSQKVWFQFIFIAGALVVFAVVMTKSFSQYLPSADVFSFLLSPQMFVLYFVVAIIAIIAWPKPAKINLAKILGKEIES